MSPKAAVSTQALLRFSGLSTILGGVAIALFVLLHPWDDFVGATVGRSHGWRVAHTLHFVGAAFSLLGLPGLYVCQRERLGRFGFAGFVCAFLGMAMFLGTGMITAFVWPMLAVEAPAAVELGGAMFNAPALIALGATAVVMITGYVSFGIATLAAGVLPRWATIATVTGAVLGMIPPQPLGAMPWAGLVLGGVLYGIGAVGLGRALLIHRT